MKFFLVSLGLFAIFGCSPSLPSASEREEVSAPLQLLAVSESDHASSSVPEANASFSFSAFGDSGWARTHVSRSVSNGGFKRAYASFDPTREFLSDINYINWETSVGVVCGEFWAPSSSSTYAFLTHPQELSDAISLGFGLIGLANNHAFDCVRSPEGRGPLQSAFHVASLNKTLASAGNPLLFSGVFSAIPPSPAQGFYRAGKVDIPISFVSAYVGGDSQHCKNILCDRSLGIYKKQMASARGLRVLALHSWDAASHSRLKSILSSWLREGLVDIAIGTGPHVAESVSLLKTPRGSGVLATSLGNFIHPSLSAQPRNIVLVSAWSYAPSSGVVSLNSLKSVGVSCDGSNCRRTRIKSLL